MTRLEGWEVRFDHLVKYYLNAGFEWGENDCFVMDADVIVALSGHDPIANWRGKWSTKEEAYSLLKSECGGTWDRLFEGLSSVPSASFARRADVGVAMFDGDVYGGFIAPSGREFYCRAGIEDRGGLTAIPLKKFTDGEGRLRLWRVD